MQAEGLSFKASYRHIIVRKCDFFFLFQIDEDMTARISMADAKFSFQCPGRMYSPAWMAPEGTTRPHYAQPPLLYYFLHSVLPVLSAETDLQPIYFYFPSLAEEARRH